MVAKHLDPILKAADELLGKLLSSRKSDFKDLDVFKDSPVDLGDLGGDRRRY